MNFSFSTLQAAQATTGLITRVNADIQQAAALDEQPGVDQASNQVGEVRIDTQDSFLSLSYDPETAAPQSFEYQAKENLHAPDGTLLVAAGTQSAYQRDGQLETFRQDIPTEQGVLRQEAVLDNGSETINFQEYFLAP